MKKKASELEDLLVEISNNPDDLELRQKAVSLHEEVTNYKSGCGACIAGRNLFIKGLESIASGESSEGLAQMRASMRSFSLKWATLRGKIIG